MVKLLHASLLATALHHRAATDSLLRCWQGTPLLIHANCWWCRPGGGPAAGTRPMNDDSLWLARPAAAKRRSLSASGLQHIAAAVSP